MIVAAVNEQPATVLAWHRQDFRLYWRWKSRPNPVGRPTLDVELRDLIRRMARENPTWGRRRIRAELALLGYEVAELTVAKYMHRTSPRPSPTWRVFLTTHARDIVAIDFFLVPTLTFLRGLLHLFYAKQDQPVRMTIRAQALGSPKTRLAVQVDNRTWKTFEMPITLVHADITKELKWDEEPGADLHLVKFLPDSIEAGGYVVVDSLILVYANKQQS